MVDGKRIYHYSYKRADCVNWLTEMRTKVMQNQPITEDVTVLEWGRHYIEVYAKGFVRPSTLTNYICYLEKHIAPSSIANIKLSKLTADHVQMFVNGLRRLDNGQALKAHTVRNIWLFLSAMLECAVNNGLIWRNVAAHTKLKKSDVKKRPILSDEDVQRLIAAADGKNWQIGIVLLTEGLRLSELLGLRHSSIIVEDGVPCLNITHALKRQYNYCDGTEKPRTELKLSEPKTDSSIRKVPILPSILDKLDRHLNDQIEQAKQSYGLYQEDPFIISSDLGTMVDPGKFRAFFIEMAIKAGIPSTRPHDLRHFAASRMIRQGASPVGAARALGHQQSTTTLNIYCAEPLTGALDALMTLNDVTAKHETETQI